MSPPTAHHDLAAFHRLLLSSRRVLALCGAGLSAASGLPTFRGAGGLWRNYEATALATPEAFAADPGLVWLFYAYRRHMALSVRPNAGHRALAALARRRGSGFLCLSQNVDGLSQRAGHPAAQLRLLHGSLFDLKCQDVRHCGYVERDNFDDPLCAALAPASVDVTRWELPHCPRCHVSLLRPGVVWFGEELDGEMLAGVDAWIAGKSDREEERGAPVDLMLVVGTSAVVYPAAGYIDEARKRGARVVTVNLDAEEPGALAALEPGDFAFGGDAAELLPRLLEPVIGPMREDGTFEE